MRPLCPRATLVDLLQFYMFAKNLFEVDEGGRNKRETLAEMYLQAQSQPPNRKMEILKKLGDTSLYISGFFGDSLNRKLVDIDYYAEMGGAAYGSLSSITPDQKSVRSLFQGFPATILEFVDALTYISQQSPAVSPMRTCCMPLRRLRCDLAKPRQWQRRATCAERGDPQTPRQGKVRNSKQ